MVVPNGKGQEENNSEVSLDVTGQAYISNCSSVLGIVSLFVFSQDDEQATETRSGTSYFLKKKKHPYTCDGKAAGLGSFAQ